MADQGPDRDVAEGVELAEKGPDFERRVGEVADRRHRPAPAKVADEDLVVGELDEDGHGSGVLVAKGDPIPPELAGLPRHRRADFPGARRRSGK
jgi:hypothetical protein